MKILIDGRLYGLENAGLGRYVVNLVGEIGKLDRKNEYIILLRKKYYDTLKLPKNWQKVLADFRHYGFSEQIKLPSIIKKINPDLTHFPHFNVPLFYRGKYVVTIHDMLMHKSRGLESTTQTPLLYLVKRFGYRIVFDHAVKSARKILVPSFSVKQEIVDTYKILNSKVKVTYEGVDLKIRSEKGENRNYDYFVYTGNAYPHKNLKRLIDAVNLLNKNTVKEIKLLISSSRNVFTQRLEKLISSKKASKFIHLLGFVPDNELGDLYENSVAFVFPPISEGFGLPGLEAMASGTLLLASDIPVFREIYKGNAIYFDPYSPESIKIAMKKALKMDKNLRAEKILEGKHFVKRYSWAKMAKETLSLYESCNSLR